MGTRSDLRGFLKRSQKKSGDEFPVRGRHKESDEVVKYMSNLPGYLQGEEDISLQSSVLNVGVLDWSRLEKWKQHGRYRSGNTERKVSSSVTLANASHHIHRCKIGDHQVHACSNLGKKVKASGDRVRCTLEPELASSSSRDSLNEQEMPTCSYNSSARDQEGVNKSTRSRSPASSSLLSTMGNSGGSLGAKENLMVRDKETEKRAAGEKIQAQEARESRKQCVDKLDREETSVGGSTAGEKHQVVSNIVLLRSGKKSPTTLSSEPQMPLDDNTKVAAREVNRSLDFSSLELTSQVPRSCPLSFGLGRESEDMMLLPLLGVDLSPKKESSGGRRRHSKTASRIFDQEIQQDKNRHTSPSKRFSFSFGRLSRSFTFREDSSAGQALTSSGVTIKSDSMRFDGLACPSHQSSNPEEKHNTHGGSRVSPLRRLLDPLLKPKGSEPSKASTTSSNQDEKKKQDAPRTRALLQLTIRNGIPLYQFVVDDDNLNKRRSILGATMKSSASSLVKDGSVQYCTFYSVNEVKKKKSGSWLIHGHKEKQQQHRFLYNVMGEMRLSKSSTEQKSENISSVMRESVLVDETDQVNGRKEVAAVVIKKKHEEENGETTVILPGGVHSIPEKGEPTPLIRRWRSGGCCDCGGWDVGCKLHLLSNKTFLHVMDQTFTLFDQEESDRNTGPVLAMTEVKTGMYRVEFGSFLSHLQAFFVCVTVITCASEEETVSKTTGRSSSPFAPPLSPVGRA